MGQLIHRKWLSRRRVRTRILHHDIGSVEVGHTDRQAAGGKWDWVKVAFRGARYCTYIHINHLRPGGDATSTSLLCQGQPPIVHDRDRKRIGGQHGALIFGGYTASIHLGQNLSKFFRFDL